MTAARVAAVLLAAFAVSGCEAVLGVDFDHAPPRVADAGQEPDEEDAPVGSPAGSTVEDRGLPPSVERAAVMNALRERLKPELPDRDFVFNVSADVFAGQSPVPGQYTAAGDWVFLFGRMESRATGKPLDYTGTAWAPAMQAGTMFDHVEALLKKERDKWRVVAWSIGSTDSDYLGWDHHGAPASILPKDPLPAGQYERSSVMDTLRGVLRPELADQDIVFNVRSNVFGDASTTRGLYNTTGSWVFLLGKVELRGTGHPVDYAQTRWAAEAGTMFDHVEALLQKVGTTWVVKAWSIGGHALAFPGWSFEAPPAIFPAR